VADVCPVPLSCSTDYGELVIADTSLHLGAWCAIDLSELYATAERRGENVLVEATAGRVPRPMLDDETDYSVPLAFSGAVDPDDVEHADPVAGLFANRDAFVATFIDPIRAGTATLPATLDVPGGGYPLAADVQPLELEWRLRPGGYAVGVLTLRVPAGRFS
jgi:hypothetical protein